MATTLPAFPLPSTFVWGAATASYQVEGAAQTDGRGPSIWDTFSHTPGKVAFEHNGDVSADQYHRYKEDVQLLKWLGAKAYRFSVSWSRVLPRGRGAVNEAGLAYYDRLVDELLAQGITPWMTLFHWDLPQALQDDFGGWAGRDTAKCFADYASLVTKRLSDRVTHIFTINEFVCFTDIGYSEGRFAPGLTVDAKTRNQIRHHGLLAHGLGLAAVRAAARQPLLVGLAENAAVPCPVIETPEHCAAARLAMREVNRAFLTPVMEGKYPDTYLQAEGANAPTVPDGDMAAIGGKVDFVGLNMYSPFYVRAAPELPAGFAPVPNAAGHPRMTTNWTYLGPQISYWGPRLVKEVWGVDHVVISENGCAAQDRPAADGEIYDTDRVMYVRAHLQSAARAVAEGWPLKGYFLWSLLDNFEWADGYLTRFGLCYVNYTTLARTPKLSAKFYRACIAANAVV